MKTNPVPNLSVSVGLLTKLGSYVYILLVYRRDRRLFDRLWRIRHGETLPWRRTQIGRQADTPGTPLSSQLTGRTFARVTPEGVITEKLLVSQAKSAA